MAWFEKLGFFILIEVGILFVRLLSADSIEIKDNSSNISVFKFLIISHPLIKSEFINVYFGSSAIIKFL